MDSGFEPPPDPREHSRGVPVAQHAHSVRAELARAKEATRRTLDERQHRGAAAAYRPDPVDEEAASLDDEVVEDGAEVGQAVIERMLGGRVLGESTP